MRADLEAKWPKGITINVSGENLTIHISETISLNLIFRRDFK